MSSSSLQYETDGSDSDYNTWSLLEMDIERRGLCANAEAGSEAMLLSVSSGIAFAFPLQLPLPVCAIRLEHPRHSD